MDAHTRWAALGTSSASARAYHARVAAMIAGGADLDAEARVVLELAPPPSRVLDAGCGTGRIAATLTRAGCDVVGVDADPHMIGVADETDPATTHVVADLSTLELPGQAFDLVLLAGNVVPYLADGTLHAVLKRLAAHLRPGGHLVAGWGVEGAEIPRGAARVRPEDYDRLAHAAGFTAVDRWATWDRHSWSPTAGYVVMTHRRAASLG